MAKKSSTNNKCTLLGSNAADVLTVKHSQVTVKAGKGNDIITVSKGASNVLYGGAGADTIIIGKNAGKGNKIYGDAGNDTIKVSAKYGVTINGGAGNDIIYGGKGNDTFTGGKGKDTFFYANGGGKDTIMDYQVGQDTLQITSGSISKTAIAKNKKDLVFTVGKGTITLKNAAGKKISMKDTRGTYTTTNKLITLGKDFTSTMDAAKYLSTIKDIDARNVAKAVNITGNSKANRIFSGRGGGTYKCGAGNDTIIISGSAKYTVYGDAGDDNITFCGSGNGNTIYGNDGNDMIHVTNGKNVIYGGAGADTIEISGGKSHIIYGGAGTDTFKHTLGTGTIKDYEEGETISFNNAITSVTFDGRNITLTSGTGSSVTVENGLSILRQILEAGNQKKLYSFNYDTENSITGLILNNDLSDKELIINKVDIGGIELKISAVNFTKGANITASGMEWPHVSIHGSKYNDILTITGSKGATIEAGDGNDKLFGGDGGDFFLAGDGDDYLYGGNGLDNLSGGTGNDFLYGDDGNDQLYGENGNDCLYGGKGNDILFGDEGQDWLYGNYGSDKLYGGNGNDHLYGGEDNDYFCFGTDSQGNSIIYDYEVGLDILKFDNGISIKSDSIDGSDVLLNLTTGGTIKILNSVDKTIIIDYGNGNITEHVFS